MPDSKNTPDLYDQFQCWSETVPQYGMHPFPVKCFAASLHVGTTVLIERQSSCQYSHSCNATKMLVGRIVSFRNDSTGNVLVVINIFVPFQQTHLYNILLPTNERRLKYVCEVVQTLQKIEVLADEIYDICFIFTINNVTTGNTFCEGINNAYHIRYCSSLDGLTYEEIEENNYYCFPSLFNSQYGSCYISRMWKLIGLVQNIMADILSVRTQKQSAFIRRKVKLSIEFEQWLYIYNHSWNNATLDRIRQSKTKMMTTYKNLSRESFESLSSGVHFRFETKRHLLSFTNIFGMTTVGVRSKKPPVGRNESITSGTMINIIQGRTTRELPFKKNTERNGIDFSFTFDKFKFVTLVISVRYSGLLYKPTLTTTDFKNDSVLLNSFHNQIMNITQTPVVDTFNNGDFNNTMSL